MSHKPKLKTQELSSPKAESVAFYLYVKTAFNVHHFAISSLLFCYLSSLPGVDGDYFRLLLPGTYKVTASASGYIPSTSTVTVGPAEATQVFFYINVYIDNL